MKLDKYQFISAADMTLICLTLVACVAAYFSMHSLLMASTVTSTLPLADIWRFYADYFNYVDGNYSFWFLFRRHNEHVIVMSRLALFVDTIWFDASGKFVLAVAYLTALITALMIAYLAAKPSKREIAGLTVAFSGLTWALIQIDNLTLPFHVVFPLVHAFALATLIALWLGLARGRWWYVLAFAWDFGVVFSIGTGVMVGVSAVALAVWVRKWDRIFALFLVFHCALVVLYAWPSDRPWPSDFHTAEPDRGDDLLCNFPGELRFLA